MIYYGITIANSIAYIGFNIHLLTRRRSRSSHWVTRLERHICLRISESPQLRRRMARFVTFSTGI